ncbi:YhgE/Pip domain-containing protein [Saccharopolyspora spinosporotrichia]
MSSLVKGRSRFRLPVLPLLGLLLVPLAIAGLLTWSLGDPGRLKDVKAAVVNNDKPVEVGGQLAPLGRQLSAKLVGGEIKSNYSWEFATPQTAEEGLRDGTYAAVVTIPENFSAAATSFSGDPAAARRATIDVSTGERSRLADEAISRVVTTTAANLLGQQLTTTYLDNVYVGFNTLGDKLGDASEGATSLADGAEQLAGGTGKLSDGAGELAKARARWPTGWAPSTTGRRSSRRAPAGSPTGSASCVSRPGSFRSRSGRWPWSPRRKPRACSSSTAGSRGCRRSSPRCPGSARPVSCRCATTSPSRPRRRRPSATAPDRCSRPAPAFPAA